ncbi:hypothetical protein P3X46_024290 [Hevea brasiliensis]|uniref:Rx N-terminal domain-containing protein n=1 Tax=Hevea brasiliensis TaxID=3981 RepID=A0ABQ9L212_HEVBR|nr:hypothetical protein P3X46_024290 [Hevea brasiliensis]
MAEQIPFSIAQNLLTNVASFTFQEIGLVYGVKNDLCRLENTLSSVKAILLDAEWKQENSHAVKNWIKRLKDVVYDADDLLDQKATEDLRRKVEGQGRMVRKACDFFSFSNQIAFRLNIGHRIKDIKKRLDEVAEDMSTFGFITSNQVVVDMQVKNNWKETDSFKKRKKIAESLLRPDNQSNVCLVAIIGFGGLVKTTLAQLVFNDEEVVSHFDLKIWVCVSEESMVEMLVKIILRNATSNESSLDNTWKKKYLLVLDDVWNVNSRIWDQLRKYLMVGAVGSKILVTTRSKRVALAMGVDCPYALEGLTEDQSWDLLEKLVFREGTGRVNPNLIKIGKELAKKCKDSESEWLSVLENDVWKLFDSDNDIGPVLKLSYDHLPNYLRHCFVHCAMFPKDYEFDKEKLIQLWMAQGYVQCWSQSGNENLEDVADGYFNELLFRSFFQKDEYHLDRDYYKKHDLIHDLAKSIAGDNWLSSMTTLVKFDINWC